MRTTTSTIVAGIAGLLVHTAATADPGPVEGFSSLKGATTYVGMPGYRPHGDMPLRLQDHGHLVRYRNIWLRKL